MTQLAKVLDGVRNETAAREELQAVEARIAELQRELDGAQAQADRLGREKSSAVDAAVSDRSACETTIQLDARAEQGREWRVPELPSIVTRDSSLRWPLVAIGTALAAMEKQRAADEKAEMERQEEERLQQEKQEKEAIQMKYQKAVTKGMTQMMKQQTALLETMGTLVEQMQETLGQKASKKAKRQG